jgi:hypothetical protein
MRASSHWCDDSRIPLGQRRGKLDVARFALDLTWARADSESAARSESYPSPPMSGSPPLPPKASQEAVERSQGVYQSTTQDVYRGIPTTQGDSRVQTGPPIPPRPFGSDPPDRMPYGAHRPETAMARPLHYSQQHGPAALHPSYLPVPGARAATGPLPAPQTYAAASHPQIQDPLQQTPKNQRKTKGHVASACVPCKRAHLRFVYSQLAFPNTSRLQMLTFGRCDGTYCSLSLQFMAI